VIGVGDEVVILGDGPGDLQIASASPDGIVIRHRARVLEPGIRSVTGPAFADGRLYVRNLRDHRGSRELNSMRQDDHDSVSCERRVMFESFRALNIAFPARISVTVNHTPA
jgi:hypothetical protein